jgi:hypothetical protein
MDLRIGIQKYSTGSISFHLPNGPFWVGEDGGADPKADVVIDIGTRAVVVCQPVAVHVLPVPVTRRPSMSNCRNAWPIF